MKWGRGRGGEGELVGKRKEAGVWGRAAEEESRERTMCRLREASAFGFLLPDGSKQQARSDNENKKRRQSNGPQKTDDVDTLFEPRIRQLLYKD